MPNNKEQKCINCGYTWKDGDDSTHNCEEHQIKTIDELSKEFES